MLYIMLYIYHIIYIYHTYIYIYIILQIFIYIYIYLLYIIKNIYILSCAYGEREREKKKKREKKKRKIYTHIIKTKKLNTWKNMCIYILYIYTCREVCCKCAKLDLIKKRERGLGEGAAPPPKAE